MSIYDPGLDRSGPVGQEQGLSRLLGRLPSSLNTANLSGLAGGIVALLCLLVLHDPWNMLVPLLLGLMLWCVISPRMTLYLIPLAIPWGYLEGIVPTQLPLSIADLLVGLLVAGWLL